MTLEGYWLSGKAFLMISLQLYKVVLYIYVYGIKPTRWSGEIRNFNLSLLPVVVVVAVYFSSVIVDFKVYTLYFFVLNRALVHVVSLSLSTLVMCLISIEWSHWRRGDESSMFVMTTCSMVHYIVHRFIYFQWQDMDDGFIC